MAQSSLRRDRRIKADIYAESGVVEYWIVNLVDRVVEVHRDPRGGVYSSVSRADRNASLALVAFPDVVVRVADFLR